MPVLNTLEGDFWSDGHMAQILFDTGSITAAEFWKTLIATIDEPGSYGNLLRDYLDRAISTTESNIRGADNDDLKDISDQIDDVPSSDDLKKHDKKITGLLV